MRIAAALALMLLPLAGGCATGGAADVASASTSASAGSVETLDTASLASMIDTGTVTLVDVRTPEEFAAGHIPGAINIPVDGFDPAAVPQNDGQETILYCGSSRRSGIAADILADHTDSTVRHLEGGITAWKEAGQPVTPPAQ